MGFLLLIFPHGLTLLSTGVADNETELKLIAAAAMELRRIRKRDRGFRCDRDTDGIVYKKPRTVLFDVAHCCLAKALP
jgi:hypothetical protein